MPNTAKQEAIRKAYGEYWEQVKDYVDQYGRLTYQQCWDIWNGDSAESHFYKVILENKVLDLRNDYEGYYQPKSLQGIENNNGWIRIESEEDLPTENSGLYFVYDGKDVGIARMSTILFRCLTSNEVYSDVTHFQPIVKPEKPIY